MKSRADVLQSIQAKIRLLHLAYSTEEAYCGWAGRYYDFCLNLPRAWPPERKAEAFLTNLAVNVGVATHSRESIDALRQLMGHVSIETTAGYLHPVVAKATNPLDDLIAGPPPSA